MTQAMTAFQRSFIAGSDLSDHRYKVVKFGGTQNEVELATAKDDIFAGVLQTGQEAAEEGNHVQVQWLGSTKCIAGEELSTPGTQVSVDSDGKVVAASAGDMVVGHTIDTSDADGDEVEVFLTLGALVESA